MRVRRGRGFVHETIGAGNRDLGNELAVAQAHQCAVDGGKPDARLPLPCQLEELSHREVGPSAVLRQDVVDETVVFRQRRAGRARTHVRGLLYHGRSGRLDY